MKKIFLLLAACILMAVISCSDKDDNSDETAKTDLIGTWKVSKYSYVYKKNGKVTDIKEYGEEKNETFVLNKDGSSNFDCLPGESCTWEYQGGKLFFHWSYDEGETDDMIYNLTELSYSKLIMEWKNSEGNGEEYERYELKKTDKSTEKPDDSPDSNITLPKEYERINLKSGEKHYFFGAGGGHYIKYASPNSFYIGYDGNLNHYSALIDMGARAGDEYVLEKADYISAMDKSRIPVKIHHGYNYYMINKDLTAGTPTYFWVEKYIKAAEGNVIGVSIITH